MAEKLKSAEVGGKSAGYLFEFKPDGVFFTVYPTDDSEMLFELSDMRQILKEYGVTDYDMGELARAVRAADGQPGGHRGDVLDPRQGVLSARGRQERHGQDGREGPCESVS